MSFSRIVRSPTLDEERMLTANGERLPHGDGSVEVLIVEVQRFAVGEECNDEGPILFFDLGQNELLILWGQWLYDPHVVKTDFPDIDEVWERNAWFKRFELVRSPSTGLVLSLKSIGHETISTIGTVRAKKRLPAQCSQLVQANLDLFFDMTDSGL